MVITYIVKAKIILILNKHSYNSITSLAQFGHLGGVFDFSKRNDTHPLGQ